MDVSIIIVNYNVKEYIEQAITSIKRACKNLSYEIFIVDNASTDGSVDLIKKKFSDVHMIVNTENKGFAAANNQALKKANGDYILLINPDTIVQEDTLAVILNFFEQHPKCGMVGCKILNTDGTLQLACRRSFPTPWIAFTKITGLSKIFPRSKLFGKYNLTYLNEDETYEVEAISGSFMFFRKQVVNKIGYLDESFFMYGEDLDWCYRIREAGWKIYYVPKTKIIHFKGESSKKSDRDLILQFYRAMKLFVEKHYRNRYFHVPQWLLLLGILLRASLSFFAKFLIRIFPGLIDFVLLNVSMLIGIYFGVYLRHGFFPLESYLLVMLVYSSIWLFCLLLTSSYSRSKFSSLQTIYGIALGLIFNASLTFFFNQYAFSRAVVLIAGFFNILLLAGWRFNLKLISRFKAFPFKKLLGQVLLGRKAIVVASGKNGQKIAAKMNKSLHTGYEVCGIVSADEQTEFDEKLFIPYLGKIENLDSIIRQTQAKEIIFSTEHLPYDQILEIISHSRRSDVNYKMIPNSMDVIIGKASIEYIGDLPLVDIDYKLNRSTNIILKRSFDIIVSIVALLLSLPEFVYLKLFKRLKIKKIKIYTLDSKQVKIFQFSDENLSTRQCKIPTLWSVLQGKVSLVGSKIKEVNTQNGEIKQIELKPGITGLAQINKNNSGNKDDFDRYNLFYMKNYSIQLDIEIIIKSMFKI
jgi:O-antigen biosynthesis protein